uniref:Coiled-coil domain-containing protein n=1 Tax=Ditylenchus dipsaci TaxID=166011 RepID=A0A915CTC6_9BILA
MPKKFVSENTKAVAARARKEAVKTEQKKQQRKAEQEQKRQQTLEKKTLTKQAYEEEMNQLACSSAKAPPTTKLTQAAINARKQAELMQYNQKQEFNVDEAIKVLSTDETLSAIDRHPEKRVKAAYAAFEEKRLPELKKDHPTFRMSQLKQLLKKEWQKSTENPLNQKIMSIVQ